MKILYAIQATGNGHIACAHDIIPLLQERGSVDILLSGTQADIDLPFPIKYRLHGLGFVFGKNGGIDYKETFIQANIKRFLFEIKSLPVRDYDVVISDFEPVTSWACRLKGKTCVGLSHQIAVMNKYAPRPAKIDLLGKAVLKWYAPADIQIGYHFQRYDQNIFKPVIRNEIRSLPVTNDGHFTVYLPAYSAKSVIKLLNHFPFTQWQVFSKDCLKEYKAGHIKIMPVTNEAFMKSMACSEGVLCGGGFQTPSEVLFLNKKLMVVPMRGQYEQQCNAAALKELGVPIIKNLKYKQVKKIKNWLEADTKIALSFPHETQEVVNTVLALANTKPTPMMQKNNNNDYTITGKVAKNITQINLTN